MQTDHRKIVKRPSRRSEYRSELWKNRPRTSEGAARKKCNWFGHTLRSDDSLPKYALQQGCRGRGRPRNALKKIFKRKCESQASGTAGGRWSRQLKTELDGVKWSVVYALLVATSYKSTTLGILAYWTDVERLL